MCVGESLDWGVADDRPVPIRAEGLGLSRTVRGGWRRTDVTGEALIQERRSGAGPRWPRLAGGRVPWTWPRTLFAASLGSDCQRSSVRCARCDAGDARGDARPDAVVDAPGLRTVRGSRVRLLWVATGLGTLGRAQKTLHVDLVLPRTGHEHASLNQGSSLIVDVHAGPPRPSGGRCRAPPCGVPQRVTP